VSKRWHGVIRILDLLSFKRQELIERSTRSYFARDRGLVNSLSIDIAPQGQAAFEAKWNDAERNRRVLFVTDRDYSGSFMKWAKALNQHSEYAVRMISLRDHSYGYETDICLQKHLSSKKTVLSVLDRYASEASIIHFKDEIGIFLDKNFLSDFFMKRRNIPQIYTLYGGYARKYEQHRSYRNFVNSFDLSVCMTPDLGFEWIERLIWVPHSVSWEPSFNWSYGRKWAHSPSTAARKGTELFIDAYRDLEVKLKLQLDIIEGVSHEECLKRKSLANWFFDQAGREIANNLGINTEIGWYGNSAIEATTLGIPTLANLSKQALSRAESLWPELAYNLPVINCGNSTESIKSTILSLMSLTSNESLTLAKKTFQTTGEFHSLPSAAKRLSSFYSSLS